MIKAADVILMRLLMALYIVIPQISCKDQKEKEYLFTTQVLYFSMLMCLPKKSLLSSCSPGLFFYPFGIIRTMKIKCSYST